MSVRDRVSRIPRPNLMSRTWMTGRKFGEVKEGWKAKKEHGGILMLSLGLSWPALPERGSLRKGAGELVLPARGGGGGMEP
eukprot:91485-Rhodomonas_salina.1